jgi:hypothetical protein
MASSLRVTPLCMGALKNTQAPTLLLKSRSLMLGQARKLPDHIGLHASASSTLVTQLSCHGINPHTHTPPTKRFKMSQICMCDSCLNPFDLSIVMMYVTGIKQGNFHFHEPCLRTAPPSLWLGKDKSD